MIPKSAVKTMTLRMLPFADAASDELPLGQLLRLSLFQISVGMAAVMLLGTLNRVMIVELSVPAFIVATMIAIPVLIAPFVRFLGLSLTITAPQLVGNACPICGLAASGSLADWRSCRWLFWFWLETQQLMRDCLARLPQRWRFF